MTGPADGPPALPDGADKWITALEDGTAQVTSALEDMKALNIRVMGKHATEYRVRTAGSSLR